MSAPFLMVSMATPVGLLLGLVAIPVVALFLLKRRRRDVEVGSTMLWAQVLRDTLARSPFRRPREWLSLMLLLLAVAALTLGAGGLRLGAKAERGGELVVVVDVSASMATREEGESRLEGALEAARDLIAGSEGGARVTLIVAGAQPRVLAHQSGDRGALEEALGGIEVEPVEGELGAAVELGASEARRGSGGGRLVVLSDFAGQALDPGAIDSGGATVSYVACGAAAENAGIVHLAVAPAGERSAVLVTVAANEAGSQVRTLALFRDEQLIDAREIRLAAGGRASVVLPLPVDSARAPAALRLSLDPPDALPLDDVAFAGLAPRDPPRLLHVGDASPFIERLARVFPGVALERRAPADVADLIGTAERPFDLAIVTVPPPPGVAALARRELYLGCVPEECGITLSGTLVEPVILDWKRGHPLLRDVGLERLLVLESHRLVLPEGAEVLAHHDAGPQFVALESAERSLLIWASALPDSNLALIPAFPILIRNLLGRALQSTEGVLQDSAQPVRQPAGLDLLSGTVEASVTTPAGARRSATLWSREDLLAPSPTELGLYTFRAEPTEGDAPPALRHLGVSLLSERETTALPDAPQPPPTSVSPIEVTTLAALRTERPVWHWLVAAALLLLIIEAFVWARPSLMRHR